MSVGRPVRVGVTLKMYDYAGYRPRPLADIAAQARRAEDLGFDSVWAMDHLLIDRPSGRVLTHDPVVVLAAAAARTTKITLGSLVLCHAFRHVGQLAREAAGLADLSDGRFVLGLGAGWHQPEFDALGLPFDHRVSRLEDALSPLLRLLDGERVSARGRWLSLTGASVAVTTRRPPLWLAGTGPRMLELAARHADGWNHGYWGGEDPRLFAESLATVQEALVAAGRDPSSFTTSASIACVPGVWRHAPGTFTEPEVAVGPPERLAEVVASYAAAGADHVVLSLSPDPFAELDPTHLETAARILELL